MKKLLMFLLALISWDSCIFSQCDNNAFVVSLSPGISRSGAIFSMEAGIWPIAGKLGVLAGPMMYDEKFTSKDGTEKITQVDFAGRVIYKLTATGSDNPQMLTLFGTARGMVGVSYRCYFSISESELVGIEPMWGNKVGVGVNVLFTTRL